MTYTKIEQKVLAILSAFERDGRVVNRVAINGRKIEFDLSAPKAQDEFERVEMRYDKT